MDYDIIDEIEQIDDAAALKPDADKLANDDSDDDDGGSGSAALTPDSLTIPDIADPTELKRIAETSITEGHADKTSVKIGLRQPDAAKESTGPGLNFEAQPKLANQHDGMPPNLSNNPASSEHAAQDFERRVENSEVSEDLIYQNSHQLTAEKRAELQNKAANKKSFNPQLTR